MNSLILISSYFSVAMLLFAIGLWSVTVMRRNLLMVLVSVELILLAFNLVLVIGSLVLDDIVGQILSLLVLMVAASESAVGLAILVAYYRLTGSISISTASSLKG